MQRRLFQSLKGGTLCPELMQLQKLSLQLEASSFISDTHQRIVGLLAKRLGMGPCGWLLPRQWSGVMLSPADPHDRCAGRPQQHTLAGFPGCHPERQIPKQHASLLLPRPLQHFFPSLPSSPDPPPSPPFLFSTSLSHPARWTGTEIASGVYLYVQNIKRCHNTGDATC